MPTRAAPRTIAHPAVARVLSAERPGMPANDTVPGLSRDELLRQTLHHFAAHGLAAAGRARDAAATAHAAGNRAQYQRWIAICRTLDRRLADQAEREIRRG